MWPPRLTCGQGLLREPEHAQRLAPLTASFIPCSVPLALSGTWPWRGAAVEGESLLPSPLSPFPQPRALPRLGLPCWGSGMHWPDPHACHAHGLPVTAAPVPRSVSPAPASLGRASLGGGLTSVQKAAVPLLVFPGGVQALD